MGVIKVRVREKPSSYTYANNFLKIIINILKGGYSNKAKGLVGSDQDCN